VLAPNNPVPEAVLPKVAAGALKGEPVGPPNGLAAAAGCPNVLPGVEPNVKLVLVAPPNGLGFAAAAPKMPPVLPVEPKPVDPERVETKREGAAAGLPKAEGFAPNAPVVPNEGVVAAPNAEVAPNGDALGAAAPKVEAGAVAPKAEPVAPNAVAPNAGFTPKVEAGAGAPNKEGAGAAPNAPAVGCPNVLPNDIAGFGAPNGLGF